MNMERRINEEIARLPALAPTTGRLIQLLQDPDVERHEIVKMVGYDPALSAHVLRQANSPLLSPCRDVTSIGEAVGLLGSARVMSIALAGVVRPVTLKALDGYGLASGDLWHHSTAVAIAATELGAAIGIRNDALFTLGLLHDLGKTVLDGLVASDDFEQETDEAEPFASRESTSFGIDHAQAGADLLASWGLPEAIVDVVRHHHDPEAAAPENQQSAHIVHLADHICSTAGIGIGIDGIAYVICPTSAATLGIDDTLLERVLLRTLERLEDVAQTFAGPAGGRP